METLDSLESSVLLSEVWETPRRSTNMFTAGKHDGAIDREPYIAPIACCG